MCPDCRDALRTDGSGICGGCLIGEYRHGGASDIRDSGSSLSRAFFGTDRCPDSGTDSSTHSRSGGNTCGYADDGRSDTGKRSTGIWSAVLGLIARRQPGSWGISGMSAALIRLRLAAEESAMALRSGRGVIFSL